MIDSQMLVMVISIVSLIYLFNRYKKGIGQELIIAFLMAFAWVSWSDIYNYTETNYIYFGINLFPLIAWTAGLVLLREIYERIKGKNRFWKATGIYIVALVILEYVGYNLLGIQLTSGYQGLFGLKLIHLPTWGQGMYLAMGPLYLKVTDYLGVK